MSPKFATEKTNSQIPQEHILTFREDYRIIRMDDLNWVPQKRSIVQSKEGPSRTEWKGLGYYTDLVGATVALARAVVDDGDSDSLLSYVNELKDLQVSFYNQLESFLESKELRSYSRSEGKGRGRRKGVNKELDN